MKTFMHYPLMMLLVLSSITVNACNSTEDNKASKEEATKPEPKSTSTDDNTGLPGSDITDKLEKANKNGNAVFVVVSDSETEEAKTAKALKIAGDAASLQENTEVAQLLRDNEANTALVNEWQLNGVPMPLIVVLSSRGMVTGGQFLSQATPESLAAMIPSPKLEEVYAALQDGKYSIVNFSKSSFTEKDEALNECKEAVSMLDGEAVLIEVDMDNEKEANFLKQFRIDPNTTESPITVVLNKQGQVAGTATTVPEAGKLVTAAKTPVQGGCAGGPMGCGR